MTIPDVLAGIEPVAWTHEHEVGGSDYINDGLVPLYSREQLLTALSEEKARADRAEAENLALREIVSKCAAALPNGAFASPTCSIEFMQHVPTEIKLVCERLSSSTVDAESRLKQAEELIRKQAEALRPLADVVYNDNGDMTITGPFPTSEECIAAYFLRKRAARFLQESNNVQR